MPVSTSEAAAAMGRSRWAKVPKGDRREQMQTVRLAGSVNDIVAHWPELTDEQQQRLRALLRPVPEGGGDRGWTCRHDLTEPARC